MDRDLRPVRRGVLLVLVTLCGFTTPPPPAQAQDARQATESVKQMEDKSSELERSLRAFAAEVRDSRLAPDARNPVVARCCRDRYAETETWIKDLEATMRAFAESAQSRLSATLQRQVAGVSRMVAQLEGRIGALPDELDPPALGRELEVLTLDAAAVIAAYEELQRQIEEEWIASRYIIQIFDPILGEAVVQEGGSPRFFLRVQDGGTMYVPPEDVIVDLAVDPPHEQLLTVPPEVVLPAERPAHIEFQGQVAADLSMVPPMTEIRIVARSRGELPDTRVPLDVTARIFVAPSAPMEGGCASEPIGVTLSHRPAIVPSGRDVHLTIRLTCTPSPTDPVRVQFVSTDRRLIDPPDEVLVSGTDTEEITIQAGYADRDTDVRLRAFLPMNPGELGDSGWITVPVMGVP